MGGSEGIVQGVLARVVVDDIDAALPLYQQLTDQEVRRFDFRGVQLAWVGHFLLLSGTADAVDAVSRVATLLVSNVDRAASIVVTSGGAVLEGPAAGPHGPRLIARHPDGSVFEYLELC